MSDLMFGERVVHTKYHNGVATKVETESIRVKVDGMDDLVDEIDLILREIQLYKKDVQIAIEVNRNTGEPRYIIKTTTVDG